MRPVALVTGGAHRLGRELSLAFGRAAFHVAVHYRSRPADADETLRLLEEAGGSGDAFSADLEDEAAPRELVEAVVARCGRLDLLVHAASPWIEKPVVDVTPADWEATFRVVPKAAFFLAQAAEPALRAARGAILMISDVAATKAWPRHVPHAVAKAALNALVTNLAVAFGPGVRVNGLAPGIVLPPDDLAPEAIERLVARTPLARPVGVKDLVDAAVFLATNRSITGQVLAVDGGRSVV